MRHVLSSVRPKLLAILIAGSAAQFWAPAALAADACLGAKVTACLDAIKPHISGIDYQLASRSIDDFLAGDIAGKRKAKGSVTVSYHSKFAEQFELPQLLKLDFLPSLEINQLDITLRKGAGSAETEAEYEATHMYEVAIFALGPRDNCRELATPHDFYLFFHTNVKTRLKEKKLDRKLETFKPASEFYAETGWIGICGNKLNYLVSSAEWGAVQENMDRKWSAFRTALVFR